MNITKRYQGKWRLILSFSLFYSLIVLVISLFFRFIPTGVSLESQLFDQIQQRIVIDSKSDWLYDEYAPFLEELCLINLDSQFFDLESNRIDKAKLTTLISKINKEESSPQAVFIDYYNANKSAADSLLHLEFDKLGDDLILPFSFTVDGDIARKGPTSQITEDRIKNIQLPLYQDCNIGYTFPLTDPYTHSNRYFKYRTDDNKYNSISWLLYEQSSHFDQRFADRFVNDIKEFKFVLRNQDVIGEERAVQIYEGTDVLDGTMPGEYLQSILNNKVVIVGLFGDYRTKYGKQIDKFITPVQGDMSGSLLLVNTFLNLSAKIELRQHNWFLFFLLNILVGITIGMNYEKNIKSRYTSFITLIINLIASIILFNAVSLIFYVFWSTQISLGIALLVYQKKYYLFTWYQGWFTNKFTQSDEDDVTM